MKPTQILKDEHKAIKLMLKISDEVCNKLENGENVDREDLASIVDFIRTFADKCHHGKEEHMLFPVMEECGMPKEEGPIGVMLEEHGIGRSYVRNMDFALNKENISNFVKKARNYISLLEQHIDKEDNILYMIADVHIPENKQIKLLEDFEKFEKEEIGEGKHEELHKTLKRLESKYLKSKKESRRCDNG